MTGTMQSSIPLAANGFRGRRPGLLDGAADHLGRALVSWAEHRRVVGPRSIDLERVPRGDALGRPFC